MVKGQVEFIAIIGIIAVVIVAVYFAFTSVAPGVTPTAPVYTSAEQASVADTVNSFVRDGTLETLRTLSTYGGYLSPQADSVTYLGKETSYWMKDGSVSYPNLKDNFIQGLRDYINTNKDALESSLAGQGVEFGTPTISATLMSNQIVATVNMPTTFKGGQVPQPYVITIPTKISDVYDFSKAFVDYQKTERFLEYTTLASMVSSPITNNVKDVPMWITITRCGEYVFKTWSDIHPGVDYAVKITLAHIYMPGKVPTNIGAVTSYPKYPLPPMNGKSYSDLGVSFTLPDNFGFDRTNLQIDPDPIIAYAKPVPRIGLCYGDPKLVSYHVDYPAVVVVKDSLTGNLFKFAVDTMIQDNLPGDWAIVGYDLDDQEAICAARDCPVDIKVVDASGSPVDGAAIRFAGCGLGSTDINGDFKGIAPCAAGPLHIFKPGYGTYMQAFDESEIRDITVTLPGIPHLSIYFYEVPIENQSDASGEKYFIYDRTITTVGSDKMARLVLTNSVDLETYEVVSEDDIAVLNYAPAGIYGFSSGLFSSDIAAMYGGASGSYEITEAMNGKALYVYIPTLVGFEDIEDDDSMVDASVTLLAVLEKLGIGPISDTPFVQRGALEANL